MDQDSLIAPKTKRKENEEINDNNGAFNLTGLSIEEKDITSSPIKNSSEKLITKPSLDVSISLSSTSQSKNNEEKLDDKDELDDDEQFFKEFYNVDKNLDETQSKFFGQNARMRFYGRFSWLGKQRYNIHWNVDAETKGLIFDNESDPSINFPYSKSMKELRASGSLPGLHSPSRPGLLTSQSVPALPNVNSNSNNDNNNSGIKNNSALVMGQGMPKSLWLQQQAMLADLDAALDFDDDDLPDPRDEITTPLSPRSKFIDKCMQQRTNPRASLMIRKNVSKELVLKNLGMGDTMASNIAESLLDIPNIEAMNIADNNLTDKGLKPILDSLVKLPGLTELDLSQNEIGSETSEALAAYLGDENCPLKVLRMQKADIDDFEAEGFITKLMNNQTLTEIDLSNNLLGSAENLNTVMPDLTTGGEALAEWLERDDCVLQSLTLAWNMIRLDSGIALAQSLHTNVSLTHLDLSYNALGHDGGLALGDAIIDNRHLKHLILNNNNIDATACFTICIGAIENAALERLSLNGNPIGHQGARALMLVPVTAGDRVNITAYSSNILIRDSKCWFDPNHACRDYSLDLSHPFERAVAFMLLRIVATHPTYVFNKITLSNKGTSYPLDLVQILGKEQEEHFTPEKLKMISGLREIKAASENEVKAQELFDQADADGSGELDSGELLDLFHGLGIMVDEERVDELVADVDIDGGGELDFKEFMILLRKLGRDATSRLKDMTDFPVMALKSKAASKERYLPPREGIITCDIVDSFKLKPVFRSVSQADHDYAQKVARESGESDQMLGHAIQHAKLRLDEAFQIYKTMVEETRNKVKSTLRLLPQIHNTHECKALVKKICKGDRSSLLQIKNQLGQCVKPMFGHLNGYYSLDLSKEFDRICLSQLLEKSRSAAGKRASASRWGGYGTLGDTSQDGNWSCFRNEMLDKKPVYITTERFIPMPSTGKVEFDFSTVERPDYDASHPDDLQALDDSKFIRMLNAYKFITEDDIEDCESLLEEWSTKLRETIGGIGISHFKSDWEKANEIGEACANFYDNIEERSEALKKAILREDTKGIVFAADVTSSSNSANKLRDTIGEARMTGDFGDNEGAEQVEEGKVEVEKENDSNNDGAVTNDEDGDDDGDDDGDSVTSLEQDKQDNDNNFDKNQQQGEGESSSTPITITATTGDAFEQSGQLEYEKPSNLDMITIEDASAGDANNDANNSNNEVGDPTLAHSDDDDPEGGLRERVDTAATSLSFFGASSRPDTGRPDTGFAGPAPKTQAEMASEERARFLYYWTHKKVKTQAKAAKAVELLDEILSKVWLNCRQVALLIKYFHNGKKHKAKGYGTYRVELIVAIFPRILDIWHFDVIMSELEGHECGCLYARIGYLNIFNPLKPEGSWQLDLGEWEQRMMAKMFCQLAVVEPGTNWLEQIFTWKRDQDPMPGWELTQGWMTDAGMPERGIVTLTYFSGNGKGEKECNPYVKFRKSLLQSVLIDESELLPEWRAHVNSRVTSEEGLNNLLQNQSYWTEFLLPKSKLQQPASL